MDQAESMSPQVECFLHKPPLRRIRYGFVRVAKVVVSDMCLILHGFACKTCRLSLGLYQYNRKHTAQNEHVIQIITDTVVPILYGQTFSKPNMAVGR